MLGEIRLEWWRETLEGAPWRRTPNHDAAHALAALFQSVPLPQAYFEGSIAARSFDSSADLFADLAAPEA